MKFALSTLALVLFASPVFAQRSQSGAAAAAAAAASSRSSSSSSATGGNAAVVNNISIDLGTFVEISRCVRPIDLRAKLPPKRDIRLHSVYNIEGNYATEEEIQKTAAAYPVKDVFKNEALDGEYVMVLKIPLVIEVTVGYINTVSGRFENIPQPKLINTMLVLMSAKGYYSAFFAERASISGEEKNPISTQYLSIQTQIADSMNELNFCH